jgi:hypothetical protein
MNAARKKQRNRISKKILFLIVIITSERESQLVHAANKSIVHLVIEVNSEMYLRSASGSVSAVHGNTSSTSAFEWKADVQRPGQRHSAITPAPPFHP